jgi:hypothetical protein
VKRRAPIAALVAAAALLLAGNAMATRTVRIPSKVSIKAHHDGRFGGRVTSPNPACEGARKVVLYRVIENGPDQALGHDTTNASGSWSVEVSGFAGVSLAHFYAKVKPRREGTAGTIYVCKGDRSRTIGF